VLRSSLLHRRDADKMTGRIEKKSSKTSQRSALAAAIDELGFEVMPCSFCHSKGLRCKMIERSSRCGECVRRGRSCDGSGVPVSSREFFFFFQALLPVLTDALVSRIVNESKRLDREEQDAEEAFRLERSALLEAQKRLDESLARLDRIRRQKRLLLSKGGDMVRRGLASLDEMEETEREESSAVVDAQLSGALGVVDWNAVFLTLPDLPLLADPGSSGGTAAVSRDSGGS
jgi:hypothetical protein